jgi:hypothetical protein
MRAGDDVGQLYRRDGHGVASDSSYHPLIRS